ncbi:MAG: hypothetical protein GY703_04215 [Gammaproteobacteria bacterium]|nr:hypothetical protein [Gammaproteobacteria bacterium]
MIMRADGGVLAADPESETDGRYRQACWLSDPSAAIDNLNDRSLFKAPVVPVNSD